MKRLQQLEDLHLKSAMVTIGVFDGLHLGHQKLLREMITAAHHDGVPAVAITFHPHPAVILRHIEYPQYLTSPEEKARMMEKLGVDYLVIIPFTTELAQKSARSFIDQIWGATHMRRLWIGYDFALGHNREGNPAFLARVGEEMGYKLERIPPLELDGHTVSSSQVRALISQGEMMMVKSLLGRPYGFEGVVVHGEGRGRTLGIPTANIEPWPGQLLPRTGVYATRVSLNGEGWMPSVTNVGYNPTFNEHLSAPRVEALVLGEGGDWYGQQMRLEFISFLRSEQRFDSVNALLSQIQKDAQRAKEVYDEQSATDLSA